MYTKSAKHNLFFIFLCIAHLNSLEKILPSFEICILVGYFIAFFLDGEQTKHTPS